ncbi:MAG: phytanoyl-CoA dioxygenase family protein [Gammaproteobacteria bacterium]|nr:phytanoyl-CoA dioxygenase family protein [Gammaproteobacteria bacterium]
MGKLLTRTQVEQFRQTGFLSPIDVMSVDEADACARRLEALEEAYPGHLNPENRNNPHLAFRLFDELAHHPRVLDAVEDLIGADFSLWGSVLFAKEPASPHYVSWHQDATYAGVEPHDYVTPWIALTPSNRESGCMSMIPGSHLDSIRAHRDTFAEDNILTRGQAISDVDVDSAVDLVLQPGQMSIHHCRVIHGSQPNRSGARRIGFALQGYAPAGSCQVLGENLWLPVRGKPRHPRMTRLSRPRADLDAAAIDQRRRANQNWADILYRDARMQRAY